MMSYEIYRRMVTYVLLLIICGGMGFLLWPFLGPMVMALIFAVAMEPFHQMLVDRGIGNRSSALIVSLVFSVVILLPSILLVVNGINTLLNFIREQTLLPTTEKVGTAIAGGKGGFELSPFIGQIFAHLGLSPLQLSNLVGATIEKISGFVLQIFSGFLKGLPQLVLSLLIGVLAIYFSLAEKNQIQDFLVRYSPLSQKKMEALASAFRRSSNTVILTNLAGGLIQAFTFGAAGLLLGTEQLFLIFFSAFLLSFMPIVGTAPLTICLAVNYFVVDQPLLGGAWVLAGIVAGVSDNLVKPLVIQAGVRTHPFLALLTVLGGVITLGVPGLFLGPLLAGLFTTCGPILTEVPTENS
ncbi:MAG: hypothetical protein COT73_03745 [Bdellovibrio sp. CG10_big_fil_rev_8_21_14_0_10_47_8]|nr:MAG: hypothetical protein COT73_03745 [Bdellovibrio sp. CG10_big_fil_rev_8_21_14_0_10_47_8]